MLYIVLNVIVFQLLDEKREQAKNTPEFSEKDSFLTTLLKNFTDVDDMVAEMKLFGGAVSRLLYFFCTYSPSVTVLCKTISIRYNFLYSTWGCHQFAIIGL